MKISGLFPLFAVCLLPLAVAAQAVSHDVAANGKGISLSAMDRSVKPGDDFYLYSNGAWVKKTEIPADRTSISGFSQLAERTSKQIAELVSGAGTAGAAPGTDVRRIADLYASSMDVATLEARGLKPLEPELARIASISDKQALAEALGRTLRTDVDALNAGQFHTANLFGLWVAPGFHDPHHYAPYFFQGGLTLPSRDYYLDASAHMVEVRQQFTTHAAAMFRLAGLDHPEDRAARVVALETEIAKVQISLADSENIRKADNLWTLADFAGKAPGIDWGVFFQAASLGQQKEFYVWQPAAVTAEAGLVDSTPMEAWRDYLRMHAIETMAPALGKSFRDEAFHFFGTILSGVPQQRPRERLSVDLVNGTLGEAVGKMYAERYFSPAAKAKAQALVGNLLAVYRTRLEAISWMAPSTKAEALAKLKTLRVSVGYADHFRSYDGLEIKADDLAGNEERARLFEYHYNLGRIGKTTDPDEWCMTPQTVNAVEMPLNNALNFPAAILQPPFFDADGPAASNYGGIGTVIGHEISHTFDSEGSDFDAEGRVRDWWTAADREHFNASTSALAAQIDTYEVLPGLHVSGRQTLGEDIADLAGVNAAFDAYHAAMRGKTAPVLDGLTGDQQFFIAFGQNWQGKSREASLRRQILTDGHAPGPVRAETVRNLDAWYGDFGVEPGQSLYLAPEKRVRIF